MDGANGVIFWHEGAINLCENLKPVMLVYYGGYASQFFVTMNSFFFLLIHEYPQVSLFTYYTSELLSKNCIKDWTMGKNPCSAERFKSYNYFYVKIDDNQYVDRDFLDIKYFFQLSIPALKSSINQKLVTANTKNSAPYNPVSPSIPENNKLMICVIKL
ncbi:unnamed protein product [Acanthoscelides obtectus]|uniref:Uncharacterized protein n=1 Tax=Acanthoscelides obtectus TaxID=200917 RepID=A0A9P0PA99_ACAOB|nr:unnamed protein product [Acanthoscelides obtectus]CAK1682959.1 hypothetical protein AOBTE_LOCUS34019 [Acanthoscelides obtectus]